MAKLPITVQILKTNEPINQDLLDSIKSSFDEVLIDDGNTKSRSELRNQLVKQSKNDWQLTIEPWEIIPNETLNGIQELITHDKTFNFDVLNNNLITRDVRLWKKSKGFVFKNPLMEFLDCSHEVNSNLFIIEQSHKDNCESVDGWVKSHPNVPEPLYYKCLYHLKKQQWNLFNSTAEKYLFMSNKANRASVMIKYYLATVACHVLKDHNKAIKEILACIAVKPLMAEYWCLLGDIYYYIIKNYITAKRFYKNAMILGTKRETDSWPIEILKYDQYPQQMIDSCNKIKLNSNYSKGRA